MQTTTYQSIKNTNAFTKKVDDVLVVEAPLQININSKPYTVVMRTPGDDVDLVRGLLYAEDIYKAQNTFKTEIEGNQDNHSTVLNTIIPENELGNGYMNKRTLLSVSSCGICGKKELKDIHVEGENLDNQNRLKASVINEMFSKMKKKQEVFIASGGSHAAAIFDNDNNLLVVKEDIGRHNAVDKAVGFLLNKKRLVAANVMLVSGRVSYEIVTKAFIARIPIIIAVSACSSLAVDFAKEFGICLIGFSRGEKMTVYANPENLNYEF